MILPLRVFGSASVKRICVGPRELADLLGHVLAEIFDQLSARERPACSVTNTTSAWPLSSSGRPTAAASATDGCETSALSISAVPMRCPATLSTSSMRPTTQK
jgi:hypothetical protein